MIITANQQLMKILLIFCLQEEESDSEFEEFLLAIDVTSSGTPEEKLKWAFRMYDVDGNGVIDIQEMTKIVEISHPICTVADRGRWSGPDR
ncbi:neurocalcin homolog isoform X2 [Lycorma delicatula]|uniref:neurocalcin homolog isoform X2 n=1 Tax=Lycorma delicatula TaxID=130591 RepID=UPI003F51913B